MRRQTKLLFWVFLCLILVGFVVFFQKQFHSTSEVEPPQNSQNPASPQAITAKVTRVYDGDTIEIETGQKVRYIGIDSPEVYPSRLCFSDEARIENQNLVLGKVVKLVKDNSETDKYGRLLRYVYVENPELVSGSVFINDFLVKSGFAKSMTVPPDIKYKEEFEVSEKFAKDQKLGLWGKCF